MDAALCIGDYVSLYCEDSGGFVVSYQSSASFNHLYIYQGQSRDKPTNIPNPHAVTYEIWTRNRYKLQKAHRKLVEKTRKQVKDVALQEQLAESKISAEAEHEDNLAEQKRQKGRQLRYGQTIQLRHLFTQKYIHASSTTTSSRDKNSMMVCLHDYNAKHALFKILPRYKVKAEGDIVQIDDQVVLESIKSPAHFLHASAPYNIDHYLLGCEVNMSVYKTGFTIKRFSRAQDADEDYIKGGSIVRFFHQECEAYMVAEGVFNDQLSEDVHMRVRPPDQTKPRTMFPSTSAITYWQIESEDSIINGDIIKWQQQVHLRHCTTRMYMCVDQEGKVTLIDDRANPNTVFRLHPVMEERDEILFSSYTRIEHVLTCRWLHALKDATHQRSDYQEGNSSMDGIKWDQAPLRQITSTTESMYDDAFTLQEVEPDHIDIFYYASGFVPFMLNLIHEAMNGNALEGKKGLAALQAVKDIRKFMIVNGEPDKNRQKLLRNLKIVDLCEKFLISKEIKYTPPKFASDLMHAVRVKMYSVLETYLLGDSRKNELYVAKFITYFASQFGVPGDIGKKATTMVTELVRDNRKIVERISTDQIDQIIQLVRQNRNNRHLDLLGVLCVCDGIALPENQTYITKKWLVENNDGVFLTELGSTLAERTGKKYSHNKVYVSMDRGSTWVTLSDFCDPKKTTITVDVYKFLESQLDLFGKLCYERNNYAIDVITKDLKYLTWQEAFMCLCDEQMPDALRAKYCDTIIGLFINVGENQSILDNCKYVFVYSEVSDHSTKDHIKKMEKENMELFGPLSEWLRHFLDDNKDMTASAIGHNKLIEQVLRLVRALVMFGYYGDVDEVRALLEPLLNLLDGRNDKPFPHIKGALTSRVKSDLVTHYQEIGRFKRSPETRAIVDAKYRAMEVVNLLLNLQFNNRIERFVAMFKDTDGGTHGGAGQDGGAPDEELKKRGIAEVHNMVAAANLFDKNKFTNILLDLSNYEFDKMIRMTIYLLTRYYSAYSNLFDKAVQAQVLITGASEAVHTEIQSKMHILKQICRAKLSDDHVQTVCPILISFLKLCHLENEPNEKHEINQMILINHGVLDVVFEMVSVVIELDVEYDEATSKMLRHVLQFLKYLTRGNRYVQNYLFSRLDMLLDIRAIRIEIDVANALTEVGMQEDVAAMTSGPSNAPELEKALAKVLIEVFTGNQETCMKISPRQINKIVNRASDCGLKAPEFLDLLCSIVKVEELNMALKRNQNYVMKMVMEKYNSLVSTMEVNKNAREKVLRNQSSKEALSYLMSLVDLFATCAEGENQFIESLCQTVMPVEELIDVVNDTQIDNNLKRPYLRYILWAYLNTGGNLVEAGITDLPSRMKPFFENLATHITDLTDYTKNNAKEVSLLLKKAPPKSTVDDSPKGQTYGTLHFIFDAGLPFLEVFFRKGFSFQDSSLKSTFDNLAKLFLEFHDIVRPLIFNKVQMTIITNSMTSMLSQSTLPPDVIERFLSLSRAGQSGAMMSDAQEKYMAYYQKEINLNQRFNAFSFSLRDEYMGDNTVSAQIGFPSDREYTSRQSDEELPLGQEFQELVSCYARDHYKPASKLIMQLHISGTKISSYKKSDHEQVDLDVICLRILRTLIHNEERKLPENWEDKNEKASRLSMSAKEASPQIKYRSILESVRAVQDGLNSYGAILKTLAQIERRQDQVVKEYLAFLTLMLFNANRKSQAAFQDYFLGTREELFFNAVQRRMELSKLAIKERRLIAAHVEAKQRDTDTQAASLMASLEKDQDITTNIDDDEEDDEDEDDLQRTLGQDDLNAMKKAITDEAKDVDTVGTKPDIQNKYGKSKAERKTSKSKVHPDDRLSQKGQENQSFEMEERDRLEREEKERKLRRQEALDLLQYKDEGYIELVLRVLASMCDGQNTVLQDYLREQPDNIKSVNLVADSTAFLEVLYTNISAANIDLVIQLFATLNEFAVGNRTNHSVIFDGKIVDHVNYLLRGGKYGNSSEVKILDLKQAVVHLLLSMIEENSSHGTTLLELELHKDLVEATSEIKTLTEMCTTLDAESLFKVAVNSYQAYMNPKGAKDTKDRCLRLGFSYYFLLERIQEVLDKDVFKKMTKTEEQKTALAFFHKFAKCIEVMKDDAVHRVRYFVLDDNVLREEVKEKLKWNIDRSSPSSKIRDLMDWSHDIIDDVYYQRNIYRHAVPGFLLANWNILNNIVIFLSVIINIIMLATWKAKGSLSTTPIAANATDLPASIHDPVPDVPDSWYLIVLYILGGIHNLFSLFVVITYFLASRPILPTVKSIIQRTQESVSLKASDEDSTRIRERLIGFKTVYYLMFLILSIMGTVYYGYFFGFHLLNIVYNNQLLQRVIRAVTQNGKSLVWTLILGLIICYLFALVGFAVLRSGFNPNGEHVSYCASLWECSVNVLRYGLIGELFELLKPHELEQNFGTLAKMFVFHIFFFIIVTTIGLNIIFGIILDTFNELRSEQEAAEADMKGYCSICSREAFEFETHAKGFEHHVKYEHNMWAYLFFFIHLQETRSNDYTTLENHVFSEIEEGKFSFFPIGRAMSLNARDEDEMHNMMLNLTDMVGQLLRKQQIDETEKQKTQERERQEQWQKKYRTAIGGLFRHSSTLGDSQSTLRRPGSGRNRPGSAARKNMAGILES